MREVLVRNFARNLSKMPLKFAANISMMFQELADLDKRYEEARKHGFKAVECTFPYHVPLDQLVEAKKTSGLEQVLLNAFPGDLSAGDRGLSALPGRQQEFRDKLELSIDYAKALNCPRMHIMAGLKPEASEEVYLENIKYAAERLQKEGILALIEPVNSKLTLPDYFLDTCPQALTYIKKIDHPNLKLQLDLFHLQIMSGNLTSMIKEYLPYTGHIQLAQVPDRHEPNSPGEINFPYVFKVLEEADYKGWIGLEYNPKGSTVESLSWMSEMGYKTSTC